MSNLTDALKIYRPHDVEKLRASIPLLQRFGDIEVEKLYEAYSDSYCAGWLIVDEGTIQSFASWLEN